MKTHIYITHVIYHCSSCTLTRILHTATSVMAILHTYTHTTYCDVCDGHFRWKHTTIAKTHDIDNNKNTCAYAYLTHVTYHCASYTLTHILQTPHHMLAYEQRTSHMHTHTTDFVLHMLHYTYRTSQAYTHTAYYILHIHIVSQHTHVVLHMPHDSARRGGRGMRVSV